MSFAIHHQLLQWTVIPFLVLAVIAMTGCGGGFDAESAMQEVNATNAQRLSNLYAQYCREHRGKGPKNEDAFKAFIRDMNPVLLERIDVDVNEIDELFKSERDGQALTIRYSVSSNDRSEPKPIVFESIGIDGKRLVAFTGQKVEEIDDESKYQQLLKGK